MPLARSSALAMAAALAHSTVQEALRSRLAWVCAGLALLAFGAAGLLGALALTETRQLQAALLAAVLRLALAVLVAAFVAQSVVREADDRVRDLVLALPVPRHRYLAGKLAGLCLVAAGGAVIFMLPLLPLAAPAQCLLWCATLACEASIVAAFALFCASGIGHATAALAATLAFYILARAMGSIVLLAGAGAGAAGDAAQGLAYLLPSLDACARTEWLVYGTGTGTDLLLCAAQATVYLLLLLAAAAVDLARKEIA